MCHLLVKAAVQEDPAILVGQGQTLGGRPRCKHDGHSGPPALTGTLGCLLGFLWQEGRPS
jgi:hypothetical protein